MKNYLKFISSLILFGSNGVVASKIDLQSQVIVALRTLIGALFLGLLFFSRRRKVTWPNAKQFAYVLGSGISMGLSWIFLYEAYQTVGVAISSLAYYCAPILVMALTPVLFKERLTPRILLSFSIVVAGALLVNCQTIESGGSAWGMACGWLSALCHAAMVIFSKKADSVEGLLSSLVQLAASFAVSLPFALLAKDAPFDASSVSWEWVVILGVVNTGIGCYLYFSSFEGLRAQEVALLGYLEPLSAVVCALAFLGEPMEPLQIIGGALIIAGAAFADVKASGSPGKCR